MRAHTAASFPLPKPQQQPQLSHQPQQVHTGLQRRLHTVCGWWMAAPPPLGQQQPVVDLRARGCRGGQSGGRLVSHYRPATFRHQQPATGYGGVWNVQSWLRLRPRRYVACCWCALATPLLTTRAPVLSLATARSTQAPRGASRNPESRSGATEATTAQPGRDVESSQAAKLRRLLMTHTGKNMTTLFCFQTVKQNTQQRQYTGTSSTSCQTHQRRRRHLRRRCSPWRRQHWQ